MHGMAGGLRLTGINLWAAMGASYVSPPSFAQEILPSGAVVLVSQAAKFPFGWMMRLRRGVFDRVWMIPEAQLHALLY